MAKKIDKNQKKKLPPPVPVQPIKKPRKKRTDPPPDAELPVVKPKVK